MVGDRNSDISGCLISLDCTEKVIEEAISKKCNLIVSHHPIIFGGITSINSSHWVGRVIQKAISNGINIYAIHTNLDNIKEGVNKKISDLLKLKNTKFLLPKYGFNKKLEVYIPEKDKDTYLTIGDEPSQYNKKFSSYAKIIVSEDRNLALSYCDENKIKFAIMDDAFQNLTFEKDLNVLVSSFEKPFFYDDRFPMGMLRESKNNAFRADLLLYSNCPENISVQKIKRFKTKSEYYLRPKTPILYSYIKYNRPLKIFGSRLKKDVIVISSIAYPEKFYNYISSKYNVIEEIQFRDHHHQMKI